MSMRISHHVGRVDGHPMGWSGKRVSPGWLIYLLVVRCQDTTSDNAQQEPRSQTALTGDASLPPSSYKNRNMPTPRE